jgi:branched-chain amino acid transport system permease protein
MLAQQLLNGLVVGAVYALFALGFNLIFGIHKIMNLAHGAIFMTGSFLGLVAVNSGLSLWLAMPIAMIGAGLVSVLVDLIALRPLRKQGDSEFPALITSIGANLILISIAQRLSETKVWRFPPGTLQPISYQFVGLRVSLIQIIIVATVAAMVAILAFYLYWTSFGRQVRAVAGNERTAMLLGVNPTLIYFQTFFISGLFAGAAGVLIGLSFNSVSFLMGEPYMLRGFVVLIMGGLGSLKGAVVGGLVLGMIQILSTVYLPAGLSDIIIFSLLFLILVVRPSGLFGEKLSDMRVSR